MTTAVPRPVASPSTVTPSTVTSSPAFDRGPTPAPQDFERALRERSGRRAVVPKGVAEHGAHRADPSTGDEADRGAAAPSLPTGAVIGLSEPAAAPALVASAASAGTALVGPMVAGPAPRTASTARSGGSVPPTPFEGLGPTLPSRPAPSATTVAEPAGAGGAPPTSVGAGSAMPATRVTQSPVVDRDRVRTGPQTDAAGDPAAPTVAPADPMYATGAPGALAHLDTAPRVGTAVAADGRPAGVVLPPQAQVLNAISPLVTTADGTHRLTVNLAPAHLGSVRVHLEVTGGAVAVRLTVTDPATADAMRQGAVELRAQLERLGLRAGDFDVQVTASDPTRDASVTTPSDPATTDRGDSGAGHRDPEPWTGAETSAGQGGPPSEGTWHGHEPSLAGWAVRDAESPAAGRQGPVPPSDLPRPPRHDARVDVRL